MLDQNTFMETIREVAEIIRTSAEPLSKEEILNYFDKNYKGCDKNEQMNLFTVYSIFKKANELFEGIEVLGLDDALDLLTESIEDLCLLISTFEKNNIVEEKNNLGFDGHKYKLLFTGYSYEDVLFLDKAVMKSLVNRINNILLETDLIILNTLPIDK